MSDQPSPTSGAMRTVEVGVPVLGKNDDAAALNRARFRELGLYVVNLISSPGSGKTALLETLAGIFGDSMAVIEGDVQTRRDADRVIDAGSRAYQIETAGACHLDAESVGRALDAMELTGCRLLVIENVGNLVCPAPYDLGENEKIGLLSLPEGDDKVLKYPALFTRIRTLVITKADLRDYLDFDTDRAIRECRSLNPEVETFIVSAKRGDGIGDLVSALARRAGIAIEV